jgi:two-component system invasion response regulator UvrY
MDQFVAPPEKRALNVIIADDHAIVRIALKIIVRKNYPATTIEEAMDGESVIRKLKSAPFDLLILDINMPLTESFSLTRYIIQEFPALKILIFTINKEFVFAKRFLKLGAHGYMIKESKEPEISYALDKILNGQAYISDWLAEILSNNPDYPQQENPFETLSDREFEVVLLILRGYSVSEIAETLHLNASTVGTHKSRILHKLRLTNTLELLSLAKTHHIIP